MFSAKTAIPIAFTTAILIPVKIVGKAIGNSISFLCQESANKLEDTYHILYGEKDNFISSRAISEFAEKIGATLTVMENGEHWFHPEEQMAFLDKWIIGLN